MLLQVRSKADLYKALDNYNIGDEVRLKIRRGNENMELSIALEEKDSWQLELSGFQLN